jgi:hypothetical protein
MPRPLSRSSKQQETKPRKAGLPKVPPVTAGKEPTITTGTPSFISEDEFRARVAAKAYELYAQRQAVTEADDWLNAERLVKEQMLAEGYHAGSV